MVNALRKATNINAGKHRRRHKTAVARVHLMVAVHIEQRSSQHELRDCGARVKRDSSLELVDSFSDEVAVEKGKPKVTSVVWHVRCNLYHLHGPRGTGLWLAKSQFDQLRQRTRANASDAPTNSPRA